MSSHVDDDGVSHFVINAVVLFHQVDMHFVVLKTSPGMLNKYKIFTQTPQTPLGKDDALRFSPSIPLLDWYVLLVPRKQTLKGNTAFSLA